MTRISQQIFERQNGRKPAAKIDYAARMAEQPTARHPDSWVRIRELARSAQNPNSILPMSAASIWRKVRSHSFPIPTQLSAGITAWRWADIQAWLNQQATIEGGEK